jgi:hypothetical protein
MGMSPQVMGSHLYLEDISTFCQPDFEFTSDVLYTGKNPKNDDAICACMKYRRSPKAVRLLHQSAPDYRQGENNQQELKYIRDVGHLHMDQREHDGSQQVR